MARQFTDKTAFEGETIAETIHAPTGTTGVQIKMADGSKTATITATQQADGTWLATATPQQLEGLSGPVRWGCYVTGPAGVECFQAGVLYIRPLVSKYRAIVAACEEALRTYGSNPNHQISVGELSITYKDRDELLGLISYWRNRANADEAGTTAASGPLKLKGGF